MPWIESLNLSRPASEGARESSLVEKWFDITWVSCFIVLSYLSLFHRWPVPVLIFFVPTAFPFSSVFMRYARHLKEPWMRKVAVEVFALHTFVLICLIRFWRDFAPANTIVITTIAESVTIGALLYFQQPKRKQN